MNTSLAVTSTLAPWKQITIIVWKSSGPCYVIVFLPTLTLAVLNQPNCGAYYWWKIRHELALKVNVVFIDRIQSAPSNESEDDQYRFNPCRVLLRSSQWPVQWCLTANTVNVVSLCVDYASLEEQSRHKAIEGVPFQHSQKHLTCLDWKLTTARSHLQQRQPRRRIH